ncbi:MAG TPA: amidase [Acidimicrobiales bacterium]|nr:amidase [Acidimicrobiales bacterium]
MYQNQYASALEVAAAIAAKEVSPVEVLEVCLTRIDGLNPLLNAVIWRNDDEARAEARALGERIARGARDLPPFAGVPLPIKDLLPVAGQPVTFGSEGAPDGPSDTGEPIAEALRAAGFILTGRTNAPEFGSITVTENNRFGATRNPWDPAHTPGGSSGGAAASVAAGMFPVAHAGDGGGSIRIPASCCGLVGLKPSRGRVASSVPGWQGMVTEGALSRTVADTAAVLDVIGAPDPYAWWNAPVPERPFIEEVGADPGRLRVALCTVSALGLPVAAGPLAAVEHAGELLEAAGHHVSSLDADVFDPAGLGPFLHVVNAGLSEVAGIDWTRVEPHNRAGYAAGKAVDSLTFARSLADLQRMTRVIARRFDDEFDLLVTPTMTIEPPKVGLLEAVHADPSAPVTEIVAMAAFTAVFNITGQPAISLPLHTGASGLPVGVQIVAGAWREAQLLAVASQLEQADPWGDRHPRLD